jgi:hypothetical protein
VQHFQLRPNLPKHVAGVLRDLYVQLSLPICWTRLEQEELTPTEVLRFKKMQSSGSVRVQEVTDQILSVVIRQRKVTLERAILDLSGSLELIGARRYANLRRAIGEPVLDGGTTSLPHWDSDSGQLHYKDKLVRTVKGGAKNIRLVLDAFEEEGWPSRIDSPLPGGVSSSKLRETIQSINTGLTDINFKADGTSKGILWHKA